MTAKEKAISLIDSYRNILMNEDTECGNEILCTLIAKQSALIAVDEIYKELTEEISPSLHGFRHKYWNEVKKEIEKL